MVKKYLEGNPTFSQRLLLPVVSLQSLGRFV